MRTLVFRPGGLGDLLLALPALRALRRRRPGISLEVAGNAAFVPVLGLSSDVDVIHDFGGRLFTGLFCAEAPPERELEEFLARFDRALLLLSDRDGMLRLRLRECGLRAVVGGTLEPRPVTPPHMARRLAEQAGFSRCELEEPTSMLLAPARLPSEQPVGSRPPSSAGGGPGWGKLGQVQPRVTLHPGAGGPGKCWPLEAFEWLGLELARRGFALRALAGPAEKGLESELLARWRRGTRETVDAVRPSTVLELARELAAGVLHVGNDSGPTHLAAALGVPTLAVHGPTDPAIWAPRGPRVRALEPQPGSVWPAPDEVLEAALRFLTPPLAPT